MALPKFQLIICPGMMRSEYRHAETMEKLLPEAEEFESTLCIIMRRHGRNWLMVQWRDKYSGGWIRCAEK